MKQFLRQALSVVIGILLSFSVISMTGILNTGVSNSIAETAPATHVTISVNPSELSREGDVTVTITLRNTNTQTPTITPNPLEPGEPDSPENAPVNDGSYTDISISNAYGVSFETAGVSIAAGSSHTFTGIMHVTTSLIGTELSFTVSWSDNGSVINETVTTMVVRADTPYLRVTRTASPTKATPGTVVKLVYTFVNTGSVKLNEIKLIDRYVFGSSTRPMLEPFSLEPGMTTTFEYTLTMGNSTVVSTPVITFMAEGSATELTVNVTSLTIGLIQSQVTKEVVPGIPTPEGVPFTLYLTNNGNQRLSNLMVRDELGNSLVSETFSLAVGETRAIECFIPNPSTVRYLVFRITGTDSTGTGFNDNTESHIVRPYIDVSLLGLSFTARIVSPLNNENVIGIEFTLHNTGSLGLYNLILTEGELSLHRWSSIESGVTESIQLDINAGGEREMVFNLAVEDSSGNVYYHEAYITASHIDLEGLIPVDDPSVSGGNVGVIEDGNEIGAKLDGLITETGASLMKWFRILGIIATIAGLAMLSLGIAEIVIRSKKLKRRA